MTKFLTKKKPRHILTGLFIRMNNYLAAAAAIVAVLGFPAGALGGALLLDAALGFEAGALGNEALLLPLGSFAAGPFEGPFALDAGQFATVFEGRIGGSGGRRSGSGKQTQGGNERKKLGFHGNGF